MHIHLPKPIHGWRALAGEVGVIVIAVLLALGAEQIVESIRWRHEVRETRDALNREIAGNAALYQARMAQVPCVEARLDELDAMLAGWDAGRAPARTAQAIVPEPTNSPHIAVWEAAAGGAGAAALPLEDRLRYAEIYDEIDNNEQIRNDERMLWRKIAGFDGAREIDAASLIAFREALSGLRHLSEVDRYNFPYFLALVRRTGIEPRLIEQSAEAAPEGFCKPLLKRQSA